MDDKIHFSVLERNKQKIASIGATFTYRVRAYGDLESIKVVNKPTIQVHKTTGNWLDGAKCFREGLFKKSNIYDRSIFYYYTNTDEHIKANTFYQALDYIKAIYNITGGVKQYMILCGWQHEGHDTGYPDVFTLNKKAGTIEDLRFCVEEAKKYNAVMTFHDNYDDLYEENAYFDPEIVAKDCYGNNFKSLIWTEGVSNMVSFPKYLKSGKMAERVRKTVEMLPINSSYHIDVLSQEVRRYDFDPNIKMAAQEVLEYKKAVISEFEKYGITITSEWVSRPFAGYIGYGWRVNWGEWSDKANGFTYEELVPIIPVIYHGFVPYSARGKSGIISGAAIPPSERNSTKGYKQSFFMYTLPLGVLCNQTIEGYERNGEVYTIVYSGGNTVIYDDQSQNVKIIMGDNIVADNGNTLVIGYTENEYLGYTKSGKFVMEKYFTKPIIKAYTLEENAEHKPVELKEENGYISVDLPSDTAFKILLGE